MRNKKLIFIPLALTAMMMLDCATYWERRNTMKEFSGERVVVLEIDFQGTSKHIKPEDYGIFVMDGFGLLGRLTVKLRNRADKNLRDELMIRSTVKDGKTFFSFTAKEDEFFIVYTLHYTKEKTIWGGENQVTVPVGLLDLKMPEKISRCEYAGTLKIKATASGSYAADKYDMKIVNNLKKIKNTIKKVVEGCVPVANLVTRYDDE